MPDSLQSPLLEAFVRYLVPILFTAVASLVGWVLTKLAKKWETDASGSRLVAAVARLAHFADIVVADLEVTLKPQLQAATSDGKLTKAEIAQLRTAALGRMKLLLGEHGVAELLKILGIAAPSLETYLQGILEKAVAKLPSTSSMPLVFSPGASGIHPPYSVPQ